MYRKRTSQRYFVGGRWKQAELLPLLSLGKDVFQIHHANLSSVWSRKCHYYRDHDFSALMLWTLGVPAVEDGQCRVDVSIIPKH